MDLGVLIGGTLASLVAGMVGGIVACACYQGYCDSRADDIAEKSPVISEYAMITEA